ncbi:MAG TPA: flagellar hook-associated protein FlgL [Holophagaceae bacterium]|nr:flagellar hook-associated protein FlgL [Holophagaceae bacterium]
MSLRSPISINNRQTLIDLGRTKERLAVTQREISTGKRINDPLDDPTGAALVVDFNHSIGMNEGYLKQIDSAASFLNGTENVLGSITNDLQRLLELGPQAQDPSSGGVPRAQLAAEIDTIRTNFLTYSNTQEQGKYLFAGTATLTTPFSGPAAGPITYAGNAGIVSMGVSASATVATNIPGSTLFFGPGGQGSATDLFQQVTDLRDGLTSNNQAQIQTAVTNLTAILPRITMLTTDVGGKQAGLLSLKDSISSYNLTLKGIQDNVEATDIPDAVTRYTQDQTNQQVTLSSLAKVGKTNLFDFLG